MKVISKKVVERRVVYDLTVEDNSNYYIGESEILVHNSGKGFVISNLLGIEGKIFDVDILKSMAMKLIGFPKHLQAVIDMLFAKSEISSHYDAMKVVNDPLALKNPDIVKCLHLAMVASGIPKKVNAVLFQDIVLRAPDKKPNLIFDVTLQNYAKLIHLSQEISMMGYDKKNIHIVWVVSEVEVAMKLNQERDRVVPADILFDTHKGAAITMADIISDSEKTRKYMDGTITIAFNKKGVDADVVIKDKGSMSGAPDGKSITVIKANYVRIKEQGRPVDITKVTDEILHKIVNYVPKHSFFIDDPKNP